MSGPQQCWTGLMLAPPHHFYGVNEALPHCEHALMLLIHLKLDIGGWNCIWCQRDETSQTLMLGVECWEDFVTWFLRVVADCDRFPWVEFCWDINWAFCDALFWDEWGGFFRMGEPCLFGFQLAVMGNMRRNIEVTCIYIKSFMSVWLQGCLTYCLMIMLS